MNITASPVVNFGDASTVDSTISGSTESPVDRELQAINAFRIFVTAIGILGNVCVILMIVILAEFKKGITSWYILQLAIADTAFLITLPFYVVEDRNYSWIFPVWMCKATQAVHFINYYCSVSFLTIMAVDRYIAICHSFSERLRKLRTLKAAHIITAIVWTASILICVPIMLFSQVQGLKPNCTCNVVFPDPTVSLTQRCIRENLGDDTEISYGNQTALQFCLSTLRDGGEKPEYCRAFEATPIHNISNITRHENPLNSGCHYHGYRRSFVAFLYFNFVAMFIVPFLIIAICYGLIIRYLKKHSFKRENINGKPKSSTKSDKDRNRVVVMCISLVVIFTICWLPYHAHHLAKMRGIPGSSDSCQKLLYATSLLVYLNSAIDPFIYFIVARVKSQLKQMKKTKENVVQLLTRHTNVEGGGLGVGNLNGERKKMIVKNTEYRVREADNEL